MTPPKLGRAIPEAASPAPRRVSGQERWALALIAIGTAAFLPLALNRFVFVKLALVAAGVLLTFASPARGRLPRPAVVMLLGGVLILVAAALSAPTPVTSLVGAPPRYEGAFGLAVYIGAGLAGARLLGIDRAPGSTSWLMRWLSLAAIAVGGVALLELAGLRPLVGNVARPGSLLGNASDEGAWALLALGPLTAVAIRIGGRLYLVGAISAAIALVASGSRGALLGAVAVAAVLAALAPRVAFRVAIGTSLAMLALAVFAVPTTRERVAGTSPLAAHTAHGRTLLWGESLRLIGDHPLLGVGPSGYGDAVPRYHDRRYELDVGPANPPDSPHNWVLQAASSGGVVLALLAIALAGLTVQRGVRATRLQATGGEAAAIGGMLAGLVGYGVALLFHLTSPGTTPLAAVFGGALLSEHASRHPLTALQNRARLTAAAAFGVLVVVLVSAALAELPLRSAINAAASGRFAAADSDFQAAHQLRPWDRSVTATAAHAYATLLRDGVKTASGTAKPWVAKELAAAPDSVQALSDAATLDIVNGRAGLAWRKLAIALRYDPSNPDLHVATGQAARLDHHPLAAIALLRTASQLAPRDPYAWRELSAAYRAAGNLAQARLARGRARSIQGGH